MKRKRERNLLLISEGLPRFDLIQPEHVVPAVRQIVEQVGRKIEHLEQNLTPTWDGLIKPLEDLINKMKIFFNIIIFNTSKKRYTPNNALTS